jgi:5-oxoprolinase (ATP-hydrolysing)
MFDVWQVHLGSMGESIRTVIRRNGDSIAAGDVYVLNDPYNGGTHLPDVTVVSPVFDEAGEEVRAPARSPRDDMSLKIPIL